MKPNKQLFSPHYGQGNKSEGEIPKKIFLICPECHLESTIRDSFFGDLFFMSSLGLAFKDQEAEFISQLHFLIETENASEIILVADDHCRVTKSVLNKIRGNKKGSDLSTHTGAFLPLQELKYCSEEIQTEHLTAANLIRQYLFIANGLISKLNCAGRKIEISVLTYKRKSRLFIAHQFPEITSLN